MSKLNLTNLRGEFKENLSLADYTSWRVGGNVKQWYRPADKADLALFLSRVPADEPLLWIGLGSNLLVRDGGFQGTVISTVGTLQAINIDGQFVTAEAGVTCNKLAKQCAKAGLRGAAFLAGIPGTFGGALAMNAGANGSDTWTHIVEAHTVDRAGRLHTRMADEFDVKYRYVGLPVEEWFVGATLHLPEGDIEEELADIKSLLKRRNASQPTTQPCAGSVFRNPEGDFSGRLVEATGLKGKRMGGASISEKHANFIVNEGDATAADIESLIAWVQVEVENEHGVRLVPEVHIVGDAL